MTLAPQVILADGPGVCHPTTRAPAPVALQGWRGGGAEERRGGAEGWIQHGRPKRWVRHELPKHSRWRRCRVAWAMTSTAVWRLALRPPQPPAALVTDPVQRGSTSHSRVRERRVNICVCRRVGRDVNSKSSKTRRPRIQLSLDCITSNKRLFTQLLVAEQLLFMLEL
eukprot:CAMPEP_0180431604 /NCGR_PEP_ID=MMETSP1036_2-20121128/8483_1 /TAXON_ID=632150 /ORGANISM="Azadinium spinosum, Strain 3D9" /LENGTH=167 /DNA_ID=CAMNT_0022437367 /DNA_START=192 /DNA_END=695 /DNA_ORIENTATION=+